MKQIKSNIVVLLAAYNGDRFIEQQIKSILNQSIKSIDIIVNIDKSDDETEIIVKGILKNYPQIKIFGSKKKFGSSAANFFYMLRKVDFKKYKYVALSDQDDIWNKDKLKRAINKLECGYSGYSSNVEAFWDSGKKIKIVKNQPQTKFDFLFESSGPGCTFVLSHDLVMEVQNFIIQNTTYINTMKHYHDWLIYAFARVKKYKWYIDDYIGIKYRQHCHNDLGANIGFKAFLNRFVAVINGEGFDQTLKLIQLFRMRNNLFVRIWYPISRLNLLKLSLFSIYCRRRLRDKFFFFFACLILSIVFPKKIQKIQKIQKI